MKKDTRLFRVDCHKYSGEYEFFRTLQEAVAFITEDLRGWDSVHIERAPRTKESMAWLTHRERDWRENFGYKKPAKTPAS